MYPENGWYYIDKADARQGPLSRASLLAKYSSGRLGDQSLIWVQDFESWKPFIGIFGSSISPSPPPPPPSAKPTPSPPASGGDDPSALARVASVFTPVPLSPATESLSSKLVMQSKPKFPKSVLIAGIIWIILSCLIFIVGLLMFTFVGRQIEVQELVIWFCVLCTISGVVLVVGVYTVRGSAGGTLGSGMVSLIFGLFSLFFSAKGSPPPIAAPLLASFIGATLPGGLCVLAGILALAGSSSYKAWKKA